MNKPTKRKKVGRDATYDEAFKIAVATEYLNGELGYQKLANKYKLPSSTTVSYFVDWYRRNYPNPVEGTVDPAQDSPAPNPLTTTAKEAALQKELEDARLKIMALETMISIARKEFGIDILKRPGAKQSKP